ncbi:MAG: cytochrome c biogenesis CcdA family protein [Candidatus Limnocylindria bacterium]
MPDVSIAIAFAAGLISFISPCVLALVPVYLAFLGQTAAQPDGTVAASRASVLAQALLFIGGFTVVFVALGVVIGLVGGAFFRVPEVRHVAGLAVIVIGVLSTGIFGPVFDRFTMGIDPDLLPAARSTRSFTLGALVSVGWTPCIGPVLGTIYTMGASSGSAPVIGLLLLAYSAGLAVPFLAAALALPRMRPVLAALRRHHRVVRAISGLFIIAIGVMIYLNVFQRLSGLFTVVL